MNSLLKIVATSATFLLISTGAMASCPPVGGSSTVISSNCENFSYSGTSQQTGTVTLNSGVTLSSLSGYAVQFGSNPAVLTTFGSFTNNGTISNPQIFDTFTILGSATLDSLTNTGSIVSTGQLELSPGRFARASAISVQSGGTLNSIINDGLIKGNGNGILVSGNIGTVTNNGTLISDNLDGISVSTGSIATLNNRQGVGNVNGPLTYTGKLPTAYNVVIDSLSRYGQLSVTAASGSMGFGIAVGSVVDPNGRYIKVLQGFSTLGSVSNPTGTYNTYNYNLVANGSANAWDLCFGDCSVTTEIPSSPAAADTLESFRLNTIALRNAFNLQSAKLAQGLSYDCVVFDANNICIAFAGTRAGVKDSLENTTGALILAHRPTTNFRFGGYIDQTFGSSTSNGLKIKRGDPGYGLFGVWSQNADGSGVQVRVAANHGKVGLETTRTAIDSAEAGFGKSDIKSNGVQLEISRGYALSSLWSARPYLGYRQTTNKRAAYVETADIDYPLTYSSLRQDVQSFLAGVRFAGLVAPNTVFMLSAGVEQDFKNDIDRYGASNPDITGLESIDMKTGAKKTRPTASLGLVHDLDKTQRVGFSVLYRKEAFESTYTTLGMLQYARGF